LSFAERFERADPKIYAFTGPGAFSKYDIQWPQGIGRPENCGPETEFLQKAEGTDGLGHDVTSSAGVNAKKLIWCKEDELVN